MIDRLKILYARKYLLLTLLTVLLVIMALVAEKIYNSDLEYRLLTDRFTRVLAEKTATTEKCLYSLKEILDKGEDMSAASGSELFKTIKAEKITILQYVDDKLVHWSDNSFEIPLVYDKSLFDRPIVFIHNGWFITRSILGGNERLIALLRIRNDFGFQNDLVRNGFTDVFRLPEGTGIITEKNSTGFSVTDSDGEWIFSLSFPGDRKPTGFIIPAIFLWCLVFISALLLVKFLAKYLADRGHPVTGILTSLLIFAGIYLVFLFTGESLALYDTELFSGYRFSLNSFIPSAGHLFLLSILSAVAGYLFLKHMPLRIDYAGGTAFRWIILASLLTASAFLFFIFHGIFRNLIFDSNISFEPFKVLDLTVYSVLGVTSVVLLLLVPVFVLQKVISEAKSYGITFFLTALLFSAVIFIPSLAEGDSDIPALVAFYLVIVTSMRVSMSRRVGKFSMTVFFSLFFGLYATFCILDLSEKREIENKKVLAVAYSTEHDPEAEHLLLDLWGGLSADSAIKDILLQEDVDQTDIDNIYRYLHDTYFSGYWGNFGMSVVTCSNDSPLWITSEEHMVDNCFEFFRDRIMKYGHKITGTGFFFLDNQGGRSYYMGQLFYDLGNNRTNGLFIELFSDADAFQAGYSELLLDKKYHGYVNLRDYSFAKFINGNLVLRTGDFPYDKTDAQYIDGVFDYRLFNREGHKHVVYKNGNVTVMISERRMTSADVIISFAYLFAYIFLLGNLLLLIIRPPSRQSLVYFNFRQKLQITFISVLLFSFISVGVAVAFFSIRQYQIRHLENIKEKISSIYIELENKLSYEPDLNSDWRDASYPSLEELLISLSNVFNTDINLYDTKGFLMATSRREVFYRKLISNRLNMDAFINLETLTKSEYIQREKIATLEYVSAYVPFFNEQNRLLAYINLPYFRMQSVLAREISNVIVAVTNFTLLLIVLTMFMAVIISRRLTAPLRMLGEGMASVELGKKSEHISYEGHDEISEIVKQYNIMVDELQESARKLAASEREFAWREMAKQIAHEIKNPLTPMKLNIQQLYKSWKDGIPGFENKLDDFTRNQIEYIDNLSSIATAFSAFAKMPVPNPVEVNLTEQVRTSLELFRNTENVKFTLNLPADCKIMVLADKEHLNGIFSNLIKNAIQSFPPGKEGIIGIRIELKGDKAVFSVSDNGTGIPLELQKNLFTPNFTTKSSGMGMGLSIVKRYAETANGRVWFESKQGSGSVFFVELPVIYTVEKPQEGKL